jgi:membrane-associated phospholipid phosphatase
MIAFIYNLDQHVEQFFYIHRTPELTLFFTYITQLGSGVVITVVGIAIGIVLFQHRRYEYMAGLAISILGALATSYFLKLIVERARPVAPFPIIDVSGYAFPSLHATMSMAMYGFLAYIIWKLLHPPHHRLLWIIVCSILIVLIGFSRIYLGVHFLSDVLAGYIVGLVFIGIGSYVAVRR